MVSRRSVPNRSLLTSLTAARHARGPGTKTQQAKLVGKMSDGFAANWLLHMSLQLARLCGLVFASSFLQTDFSFFVARKRISLTATRHARGPGTKTQQAKLVGTKQRLNITCFAIVEAHVGHSSSQPKFCNPSVF